jgi:F0F1-type ATP synthase membrane subunit b/b'
MTTFLLIVVLILGVALAITYFLKRRVEKTVAAAHQQVVSAQQQRDAEVARARGDADAAITNVQAAYEQKVTELDAEAERIRAQYEAEARKIADEANARAAELEPLRGYAAFKDAETEVQKILAEAVAEATALRQEAKRLLDQTHEAASEERMRAQQRVKEIGEQADALLTQATRDAGRIVADAEARAEQIGGDAYTALRDKQLLEQAAAAMRNVIEGYGDRYIIPTHSVLDDLAVEFGYDAAGAALKSARQQSRRIVEQGEAAACDYVEANRREIAIRFVIDAFNGRVDAILSRTKHDNYGTLEQEIRDAFSLVNWNGKAFRNARILPSFLDARLAELKWAVVVQELARKQREEQRYLKERLRDEEKARKEYEEKIRQAAKEEELKKLAVQEAEKRFASASTEQKAQYEQELQKLREELADATQRTLTIAQQTKKGHVYIISNVGSFGEGVYKIGQTRRPEPQDRVDELGGAGVPFEFDVHALIESENAPALEHRLHKQLLALQVNKINSRKEFFRVSLTDIHQEIDKLNKGEDFTVKVWTEKAIATQYRDSLDIENDPEKKENWIKRQQALSARQLQLDKLIFPALSDLDTEDDQEA